MTTATIARLRGTFARPGVSKNRRWYKPEHIAAAVSEAQSAIESGDSPFVMLTSHGARDGITGDVTKTAARITKLGLDVHGNGTFEADILGTHAGQEVDALTKLGALKGVSMASVWKGIPRTVKGPDGDPCETADGFTLKGIDFTHNPGIPGAEAEPTESADDLLYESIEEADVSVETIEEAGNAPGNGKLPYGSDANYADPGYQKDGKKRYPLDSAKRVRAANAYLNVPDNAAKYTSAQLKRMKGKIKSAAKKFDVNITEELRLLGTEILEAYASVCLDNGQGNVSVSGSTDDPAHLAAVGRSVALAALAGLYQLDPDCDGDIDLAIGEDDDDDMGPAECSSCGADVPEGSNFCPTCGQPATSDESVPDNEEEVGMSDTTAHEGAADEATLTITEADLQAKIAEGVKAAIAADKAAEIAESEELAAARKLVAEADAAKTITESAPVESAESGLTPEAVKAMIAEAVMAERDAARKEIQEAGPRRRGLVLEQSTEELYGDVDLSTLSTADLNKKVDEVAFPLIASR